ncbi:DMT family transporter [Sphingomonas montanisoli]|uniref:DMT family transporter n=1 Tax=Sphingomonas montanisoli TaxID=2606412 RepID=A0A5D9C4K2_9SPHN|nr:DMT family transporter [Sphingomonas montanisoli]TZG26426.1 DMT family transporter [Sphingomonas montanisoli]
MGSIAPPTPVGPAPVGVVPTRIILPFIIVTLSGGSTWTAIRYQIDAGVDMFWAMSLRALIGAIAMICWSLLIRAPLRLPPRGVAYAAIIGLLQFFLCFLFIYEAERHVTSGVVAMFFALLIVPNAILARIFLKMPMSREFLIGSAVAIVGMAMLFASEIAAVAHGNAEAAIIGITLTLVGLLFSSAANVAQASRYAKSLPPIAVLVWSMVIASIAAMILGYGRSGMLPPTALSPAFVLSTVYLGLFGSALTFPLYFFLIRQIGPARAAYSGVTVPIVAMILSTILEGYRWSLPAIAGSALALIGLVIALRAAKPAR